jgi:hypothetical protein
MSGLIPAIHVLIHREKFMDARREAGHDEDTGIKWC